MSQRTIRPAVVEGMEDRVLFATFTVTTTADGGAGSLRDALNKANATSAHDLIQFKIGSGAKTITPSSGLPHQKYPVTIDASTQPGYAGKPIVEIRGDRAGSGSYGLVLRGGSSTIKGLAINRFGQTGILVTTKGGNTIKTTYVGTDLAGSYGAGNKNKGIILQSANNTVGGTSSSDRVVVSGNKGPGIQIYTSAASGNKILGTYIGTDAAGNKAIPNTTSGLAINGAANNVIGGTSSGAKNVISGNGTNGVVVNQSGAKYNVFLGNYVGTNAAGTAKVPNTHYGIEISQPNNTIGGTAPGSRNIISGNKYAGVVLWLSSGSNNKVIGNYIGVDVTGNKALGNSWRGIDISNGSSNNQIGGASSAERNVISGNTSDGIRLYQGSGNKIQGNYIGLGADGSTARGNGGDGVRVVQAKTTSILGNRIGHNATYAVHNGTGSGTKMSGNTIVNDALFAIKQS